MVRTMKMISSPRLAPLFVLAASVLALASAYVAQYGFGLRPCVLCLIQRVPFVVAGLLAAVALLPSAGGRFRRGLVLAAALVFLVNSGIAAYHVGVERHWWQSSCAGGDIGPVDVADLAAAMSKPAEARCDEPAWNLFGITMAAMNVAFSGGLALVTLLLARRMEGRP
jgi:Disulfide bond formation protein DsbB